MGDFHLKKTKKMKFFFFLSFILIKLSSQDDITFCPASGTSSCVVANHWVNRYEYYSPFLHVISIYPNGGPLSGGTEIEITGSGIRDFGSLMKCKFGENVIVQGKLRTKFGQSFNPFNNDIMICESPSWLNSTVVTVEISLTGETYTSDGVTFTYYESPTIEKIIPTSGSTKGGVLTVTGSGFLESENVTTMDFDYKCLFSSIVSQNGSSQVPISITTTATVLQSRETTSVLECNYPEVNFIGNVKVSISLNGKDFEESSIIFTYEDFWHIPATNGKPPSSRLFHTFTLVDQTPRKILMFGGFDGRFRNDLHSFYLDVMSDFYPSSTSYDNIWTDVSDTNFTTGEWPGVRAQHATAWINGFLYVFGGVSNFLGSSLSNIYKLDTNSMSWSKIVASGTAPSPRSQHSMSAVIPIQSIFIFGGRSYEECGYGSKRLCFVSKRDSFFFNTTKEVWSQAEAPEDIDATNVTKPLPTKGHSAVTIEESVWIFGGESISKKGETILTNSLFKFNSRERKWYEITPNNYPDALPQKREAHTATLLNSRFICLFGGRGSTGALNDLWLFDTVSLVWSSISPTWSPSPRFSHVAAAITSNSLLIWGGMNGNGKMLDDLYELIVPA
eukprot:c20820_g1_i1.p1 GENE.c20820_g1_i1~~c20820_g1_i1.p1  ORF type:complete len:616 (+),score=173.89 c20820_g1_i1:2-1849(+)